MKGPVKTFDWFKELKLECLYCCADGCGAFYVQEKWGPSGSRELLGYKCKGLEECERCKDSFCKKHFSRETDNFSRHVCKSCFQEVEEQEQEEEEEESNEKKRLRDD